jgi:hypothetical protein
MWRIHNDTLRKTFDVVSNYKKILEQVNSVTSAFD